MPLIDVMLVMKIDSEARYDRFDQVLAELKQAGIAQLGFAGNEAMVGCLVFVVGWFSLDCIGVV